MNNVNTIASLVLSGAGESLYEIDVQECTPVQAADDPIANIVKTPDAPASKLAKQTAGFGFCWMASNVVNAATPVPYSAGFVATGGAVPTGLAFLVWAPLVVLILGGVVWLMVLNRQPQQGPKDVRRTATMDSSGQVEQPFNMQKAA